MIHRSLPNPLIGPALVLLLVGAAFFCGPVPAGAASPSSGWVFDRLTWSPGGDSLAVEAVEFQLRGERFERSAGPVTLVVDARTGTLSTPVEARAFQLRANSGELLLLGSWGLWHFDMETGRSNPLHVSPPGSRARIYDFAFDESGLPLFLVGAAGDTVGGLFRGDSVERPAPVAPFHPGGPDVPSLWTETARPSGRPQIENARGPRTFAINGFSGEFHYDGRQFFYAPAAEEQELIADSVEIRWASWPPHGGTGLVSLEERHRPGSGAVLRFCPGKPARRILAEASPQVAWRTDREAIFNDAGGHLHVFNADEDDVQTVTIQALPAWAANLNQPWTAPALMVERWPLSARDEDSRLALIRKCEKDLRLDGPDSPFAVLVRGGEGEPAGSIEGVGHFPTTSTADQSRPALEKRGLKARVSMVSLSSLWGVFDSGFLRNEAGSVAFLRRPEDNRPFTEVWLRAPGKEPRRLLSTRIEGS